MLAVLKIIAILSIAATSRPLQEDAGEILAQLSDLRLDRNQIYHIRDVTLRRDAISLSFQRGAIAFLEPVQGNVTGAVFVGTGDVLVIPPDDVERRQLNKFTGSPILNEEFNAALIRFTDNTYGEILRIMEDRAAEDVRADELEELLPWDQNLGEVFVLQNFRILTEFLSSNENAFFSGMLNGETLGWFDVVYDETSSEEIFIGASRFESTQVAPDIWASFNKRSEPRGLGQAQTTDQPHLDVISYDIDTTIRFDGEIVANAVINLLPSREGERGLTFNLSRNLRVTEVRLGGRPLRFFQHPATASPLNYRALNEIVVVLPSPTAVNRNLTLEFYYDGQVLERRGRGVYFVNERSHWYPNIGFGDPAQYDLTFHYPATNTLVATGSKVQELYTDGIGHSRWTSEREYFHAGFNYGDFSIVSNESGAVSIDVYMNNDIEAIYQELQSVLPDEKRETLGRFLGIVPITEVPDEPSSEFDIYSRQTLSANILEEVRSTIDFFSESFGPYPFDRLSVSQFPIEFSEGWPSLLYVSTASFLDAERRERLGFDEGYFLRNEFSRAREIAHQWFGNTIGWRSYRDQWLIEGLANYAGLLYLKNKYGGSEDVFDDMKRRLFGGEGEDVAEEVMAYDDSGPVWLGRRLLTSQTREGYLEAVHTKSTWILYMLRSLMSESLDLGVAASSDSAFHSMLREFLNENFGQVVSTGDFKTVAERYMTDRMDLEGDGRLDWFFDQWVFRTGIPRYEIQYDIQESLDGFIAAGRVTESELNNFVMRVPVYSRTTSVIPDYLGDVIVDGDSGEFLFYLDERPAQLLLDPNYTVLRKP